MSDGAAAKVNHHKVHQGEPGRGVVTEFKDGRPVIENLPAALASPPSSMPAVAGDQNETKPTILSRYDKKANLRFTLIKALHEEAAKERGPKVKIIDRLLGLYNGGLLLPGLRKELGPISRRTFYRFLEALYDKGINGLVPQYAQSGRKPFAKVTRAEKEFLIRPLLHQNRPKISDAIRDCKKYLGEYSTSTAWTLRRYIKDFKKNNNDIWILEREGEKAWNDKIAPYQDRDPMCLEVGQVLVADGHRLNLNVLDPITGKNKRATIVLFWDWKSTYPLGLGIGFSENIQCIWEALRSALLELGKMPAEIYIDNGKAFLAKVFTREIVIEETEIPGILERLDIRLRRALKYHGQSKPIERFFLILNDRLERRLPSYTGDSIEDKPAYLLRNEPRARALHDDRVPTISEVFRIFYQWREEYIDEPLPKRRNLTARQMFEEGKGQGLDAKALCFLMMAVEVKTVRRCRFTFAGVDWTGDCLYGYKGKIIIRYSLSDFSQIYVFDPKEEFMGTVGQASTAHPVNDWQAAKRIVAKRRAFLRRTKDLGDLIREKSLLIDGRQPAGLVEYIEAEEAKKPQNKIISPFLDAPESDVPIQAEPGKIDMAADHGSPLSGPWFEGTFERYDWYCVQDPDNHKIADLCWIDYYEDSFWGRHLEEGSYQSHLKYLFSKRPIRSDYDGDGGNGQQDRKDCRLGHDPAIERRWEDIKNAIVIDSISGLSQPAEGIPGDDEMTRYEFYRGIENRFPGTLTNADWEKVKEYEETRNWEFHFSENGISRLKRTTERRENEE